MKALGFVLAAGVLAAITTNIPYWNWYGFPIQRLTTVMAIRIIPFMPMMGLGRKSSMLTAILLAGTVLSGSCAPFPMI